MKRIEVPGMGVVEFPADMSDDDIAAAIKRNMQPQRPTAGQVLTEMVKPGRDLLAGAVRGAGSIGSTILAPMDMLNAALMGQPVMSQNRARREGITGGLESMGANPDSMAFGAGKVFGEIAGTAGAGPAVASAMPAGPLASAIGSAGFNAGGLTGARGLATRAAGGAITGGASAGLVNPEDAGTGALIGGVLPGAVRAAGAAGRAFGNTMRGPQADPRLLKSAQDAIGAGYVIPPTQVKPTMGNRLLEGFAGKLTTAQNASARNQVVTNQLVKRELGLADDVELSVDALDQIRKTAGKAYEAVSSVGKLPATGANLPRSVKVETFKDPLLGGTQARVDTRELVQQWRQSNADATAYFRSYARTADPETLTKARQASADSKAISEFLERSLNGMGADDLVTALRDARVTIAKTHSAEAALNPATGNIDARRFAKDLAKGKPLSGGFKQAGDFALQFPKAAQPIEGMGSLPQTSPLDWLGAGGISMATGNPLLLAGVAARPLARAGALSGPVQRGLLNQGQPSQLGGLLGDPYLQQLLLRAAPATAADR